MLVILVTCLVGSLSQPSLGNRKLLCHIGVINVPLGSGLLRLICTTAYLGLIINIILQFSCLLQDENVVTTNVVCHNMFNLNTSTGC